MNRVTRLNGGFPQPIMATTKKKVAAAVLLATVLFGIS